MDVCPKCKADTYPEDNYCGMCGRQLETHPTGPFLTQKEINVSDVRLNLGIVYFKLGRYDKALEIFEKSLKINPENPALLDYINRIKEDLAKKGANRKVTE